MAEERVESEGFFEMLWDCDHCDATGLLGKSQRYCASCGAPQNPAKRYFPQQGDQRRVDGHKFEGADRTCPACEAPQSAKANNCTHCGSPLDGAREVVGVETPAPVKKKRRWWLWIAITAVVAIGLGFAIWYRFIRTREAKVTVAAHQWERKIAVEEFRERDEGAWRDQLPGDVASPPMCFRKQRTTRQIEDGEDCHTERKDKKDGTFEQIKKCKPKYRSESVEDDWCTFRVRRWTKIHDLKLTGGGLQPAWPSASFPAVAQPVLGAQRPGAKGETYTLDLTLDDGKQSCDVSEDTWRKYADGQRVKVEVRASSGDVVCGSL